MYVYRVRSVCTVQEREDSYYNNKQCVPNLSIDRVRTTVMKIVKYRL